MIRCPLNLLASISPDRIAFRRDQTTYSYAMWEDWVAQAVVYFKELGVKSGDEVVISSQISIQWAVSWLALIRLGAVALMVNPKRPDAPPVSMPIPDYDPAGVFAHEAVLLSPDAPVSILTTSGTTGTPKFAMHSLGQFLANAGRVNAALGMDISSKILLTLPVFHVGGATWLWRSLLAGAELVISSLPVDQAVPGYGITHFSWVPTQLYRFLKSYAGPIQWPSLKVLFLGGAAVSDALLLEATRQGLPVWVSYGMTEMTSTMALRAPGEDVFRAMPGVEIKITDDQGVKVRSDSLFLGYYSPDFVRLPTDSEGYFLTGDFGESLGEGFTILGRKDDLIISGGENIWPSEIEAALLRIPGVVHAKVNAIDDPEFGQRPVAYVELHPDVFFDEVWIKDQLRLVLPGFKVPVWITPFPELF